jgi:hypothetical protein
VWEKGYMDLMGTVAWVSYLVLYHIFGVGEGVYGCDGSGIGFHGFPLKFGEEASILLPGTVAWVGYLVLYHIFGVGEGVYGCDGSGIGFHGFPLKFGEEANILPPLPSILSYFILLF